MPPLFQPSEARLLLRLGLPVMLAQLAQTGISTVDIWVAGKAGVTDMAAVAVAASFWVRGILFGQGLLMAITPLVAQAVGAGQKEGLGRFLRQGFWMALLLSIFLMLILYAISRMVPNMDSLDPMLATVTSDYLLALLWGTPGMMFYGVQRSFLEGQGRTQPAMIAGFIAFFLNIPLNFIFVFGWFGIPAMGGAGCGVASAILCWVMCLIMLAAVLRFSRRVVRWEAPSLSLMGRVARIGLPGAFALLVETSTFAVIALLVAPLGAQVVGGHQVALNVSSLLFILPLSLGVATTIRTGIRLGEGNLEEAHTIHRTSLCMALMMASVTAISLVCLRYPIARLYQEDPAVLSLAVVLLAYTALYQFPDAMQVVTMAVLRGYNDTRAMFGVTFLSYWVISLPLGYVLCMTDWLTRPLGAEGFWIGIIVGLTCATLLLLWRTRYLERLSPEAVRAKISR